MPSAYSALLGAISDSLHSPLSPWLAGSILAYVLAANLAWLLRSRAFQRWPHWPWVVQAARFLFFLGVPYLALGGWPRPALSGLLSLDDLGLVGFGLAWPATDWLGAAGRGLVLGAAGFLILLVAWIAAKRLSVGAYLRLDRPLWATVIDGLVLQVHWAFYRAALSVVLADVYSGVFAGLALIYLEWTLDPFWRQGWRSPSQATARWLHAALALITAVIFLSTRNLWICLAVHWATELTFSRLARAPLTAELAG